MKKLKVLLSLLLVFLLLVGCTQDSTPAEDATDADTTQTDTTDDTASDSETEVVLRRAYSAPHGTRSFARVAVVMNGDVIVAANIEEFQYGGVDAENEFLPNSDLGFGEGSVDAKLYSKRVNDDLYSQNMAERGEATMKLVEGYKAIEDYAKGKTVADLEALLADSTAGELIDDISSSTLVDTYGYVQAIIDAAKNTDMESKGVAKGNVEDIQIGFIQHAAHGERAVADTVVAVLDGVIVAANIDEFQYLSGDTNTGVPNSDDAFGENYAEGGVLASKRVNNESYSANMEERGEATMQLVEGYRAIEDHTVGMTAQEVNDLVNANTAGELVDDISSSTLVDTVGYLESIALAAENLQ